MSIPTSNISSSEVMSRRFLISLVRHGETLANRQRIMQGQSDTQLSDLGKKQAQLLAAHLKDETFTNIFSSDLARAADTARAIIEANKSFTGDLVLDRRLRERAFGTLEGKAFPEYKKAAEAAQVPLHDYTPEGGETLEQVSLRAAEFFNDLCRLMAEPLILISGISAADLSDSRHVVSSSGNSCNPSNLSVQCVQNTEANSLKPLNLDIPNCDRFSHSHVPIGSGSGTSTVSGVSHISLSNLRGSTSIYPASVLIVSHGLLLKELKRLILERYIGKLEGSNARNAGSICPNTGLSRFTMSVVTNSSGVSVKCEQIHLISGTPHLASVSDSESLVSQFQGAL